MNRKITVGVTLVTLVVIISILLCFHPSLMFHYSHRWKYNAEFSEYENEFNLVKNYVYDNYLGSEDWVSVSYDQVNSQIRLYLPNKNEYATLPDDVCTSLMMIRTEAFSDKDSVLNVIRIEESRVAFCIENGQYALIWSPSERPTGVGMSDNDFYSHIKKINAEWYHSVKK